jgi:transposase-like protein
VFILADRGTGQRYVISAKATTESIIRPLLAELKYDSLTVYTDGFRAYEPLEAADAFDREYVVHGNGEYLMKRCISTLGRATRRWCDGGSRHIVESLKTS